MRTSVSVPVVMVMAEKRGPRFRLRMKVLAFGNCDLLFGMLVVWCSGCLNGVLAERVLLGLQDRIHAHFARFGEVQA